MSLLTCKEFLSELNEYLDQTVDPEIRRNLEQHINECPNCWVIFDTTKKTLQIFKGLEPQVLAPDIEKRLMEALERKCGCKAKPQP